MFRPTPCTTRVVRGGCKYVWGFCLCLGVWSVGILGRDSWCGVWVVSRSPRLASPRLASNMMFFAAIVTETSRAEPAVLARRQCATNGVCRGARSNWITGTAFTSLAGLGCRGWEIPAPLAGRSGLSPFRLVKAGP